jgi:hypothetical protein
MPNEKHPYQQLLEMLLILLLTKQHTPMQLRLLTLNNFNKPPFSSFSSSSIAPSVCSRHTKTLSSAPGNVHSQISLAHLIG